MSMSIPVYLFTGFLDAGKTAFIQETLEDPGFNTGEKTLVLLCEEGENEYRPERFAGGNVSFLPVEEQAGLTTAFLKDYQKKHRVDRVLIEYNGMWPLQALYDALPTDWDIYQIILLADSTTFASYMTNMRQLAVDKLQDPEMVIFNRCTDATDKAYLHRAVRMVNRRAQMAFERTDGSVDPDDVVDELPFDTDAPVIDIADEDFGQIHGQDRALQGLCLSDVPCAQGLLCARPLRHDMLRRGYLFHRFYLRGGKRRRAAAPQLGDRDGHRGRKGASHL